MGTTRKCPECGKLYTTKARFCRADGSQLVDGPPDDGGVPVIDIAANSGQVAPTKLDPSTTSLPPRPSDPAMAGAHHETLRRPNQLVNPAPAPTGRITSSRSSGRQSNSPPGVITTPASQRSSRGGRPSGVSGRPSGVSGRASGSGTSAGPSGSSRSSKSGGGKPGSATSAGERPVGRASGGGVVSRAAGKAGSGPARTGTPGSSKDPYIGRVIAGRFQLEQFLGAGATGVVYRANHKVLNRPMAVKLLKREFIWDERSLLRFLREARTCSVMDHPNIVYLYDYGRDELGEPYLVMEYVAGQTLHQAIQNADTRTLPVSRAIHILLQVARALEHAHSKGVVHRDIKPENIVLTHNLGDDDWVKVLDFGVARIVGQAPVTGHGQVTGTAEFIAPETLIGDGTVAPPVDMYALGMIFHEALVGRPPFTGPLDVVLHQQLNAVPPLVSERSGDSSIPLDLDLLVARLLEKDPTHRPSSTDLCHELEQIRMQMDLVERGGESASGHSLQSVHDEATRKLAVTERPTAIQVAAERPTSLVNRLDRPTQLVERHNWPTQLLPQVALEQNDAETQLLNSLLTLARPGEPAPERPLNADQASYSLHREATNLAQLLWPGGWPQALVNLRKHIEGCDKTETDLLEQLTLVERHLRDHDMVQERHQKLRQSILSLSERLQTEKGLSEEGRSALLKELEELERTFFATEAKWRSTPQVAPEPLRQRLSDVRADRTRARLLFARLILEMPCPQVLTPERARVSDLLSQAERPRGR